MATRRPIVQPAYLLREDADLAAALAPGERERAAAECVAPVATLPRGRWPADRMRAMPDWIGLLVLDGVLIRRVGVDGRFGAELLGEGDILRPWEGEDPYWALAHTTGWRVVDQARVAVLDGAAAARLARYPALTGALVGRALHRSRSLALMMAIVHNPRIETRLHMLLWHLADRWGRVRRDGVLVPLRLTHSVLADLVAAQRPSVTGSLRRLAERELVHPSKEGWVLCADPPGELLELQTVEVAPAKDAA